MSKQKLIGKYKEINLDISEDLQRFKVADIVAPNGKNIEYEQELSIKIPISKDVFDDIQENFNAASTWNQIFIYPDGYRIIDGVKFQRKTHVETWHYMEKCQDVLIPFRVSSSVEEPLKSFDIIKMSEQKVKHRIVLIYYFFDYEKTNKQNNVRIAVTQEVSAHENRYYFEAEMELHLNPECMLADFLYAAKSNFWDTTLEYMSKFNIFYFVPQMYNSLVSSSLVCAKVRTFKPLFIRNLENHRKIVTLKFDGIRANLYYDPFKRLLVMRTSDFQYDECRFENSVRVPNIFSHYPFVIFQAEKMDNVCIHDGTNYNMRHFILTDICGVFIDKDQYTTFPQQMLELFDLFSKELKAPPRFPVDTLKFTNYDPRRESVINPQFYYLNFRYSGTYQLYCQFELKGSCADLKNRHFKTTNKVDGRLLILGLYQSKVKVPTVDIEINGLTSKILDDTSGEKPLNNILTQSYKKGIYEITLDEDNKIVVLRRRKDRFYPCTNEEYEEFKLQCFNYYSLMKREEIDCNKISI